MGSSSDATAAELRARPATNLSSASPATTKLSQHHVAARFPARNMARMLGISVPLGAHGTCVALLATAFQPIHSIETLEPQ